MSASTSNARLQQWVDEWAAILQPESVYWCDGSAEEYDRLCQQLVDAGVFTKLDRGQAAQQLLGPLRSGRRRPRRGPARSSAARTKPTPARTTTGVTPPRCAPR